MGKVYDQTVLMTDIGFGYWLHRNPRSSGLLMGVVPNLELSRSDELRLPLRWVAILANAVECDLAVTSGIHTASDALKAVLVGAHAVMMASAVLRHGPRRVTDVLRDMQAWLDENEYESLDQLRGSMSFATAPDSSDFVRANYVEMLESYSPPRVR